MKRLFFAFSLLIGVAQAQSVKVNTYDRFIKKRVIETSNIVLKQGRDASMQVRLGAVGDAFSVFMEGHGEGAVTVKANDEIIFLLANDSTVSAKSVEAQTFNIEGERSTYEHEYSIDLRGLQTLSRHNTIAIRKYGVNGYVDMKIPADKQGELKKIAQTMLNELAKVKR